MRARVCKEEVRAKPLIHVCSSHFDAAAEVCDAPRTKAYLSVGDFLFPSSKWWQKKHPRKKWFHVSASHRGTDDRSPNGAEFCSCFDRFYGSRTVFLMRALHLELFILQRPVAWEMSQMPFHSFSNTHWFFFFIFPRWDYQTFIIISRIILVVIFDVWWCKQMK